jgi:hypothetical protein
VSRSRLLLQRSTPSASSTSLISGRMSASRSASHAACRLPSVAGWAGSSRRGRGCRRGKQHSRRVQCAAASLNPAASPSPASHSVRPYRPPSTHLQHSACCQPARALFSKVFQLLWHHLVASGGGLKPRAFHLPYGPTRFRALCVPHFAGYGAKPDIQSRDTELNLSAERHGVRGSGPCSESQLCREPVFHSSPGYHCVLHHTGWP